MIKGLNSINEKLSALVQELQSKYFDVRIDRELIKEPIEKLVDIRYSLNTLTSLMNQEFKIPKTIKANVSDESLVTLSKLTHSDKYINKRSGKIYKLLYVTNKHSTRDDFIETAVYIDPKTNTLWSRSYEDFIRKNYKVVS